MREGKNTFTPRSQMSKPLLLVIGGWEEQHKTKPNKKPKHSSRLQAENQAEALLIHLEHASLYEKVESTLPQRIVLDLMPSLVTLEKRKHGMDRSWFQCSFSSKSVPLLAT